MPVFPMMAVPAAVPVVVKMASAKGERVITAREQMRTRLGEPISVVMRSVGKICINYVLLFINPLKNIDLPLKVGKMIDLFRLL